MPKKRVFSGTRATGRLHLGNYLGAVKGYLELQNNPDYETIYMVMDLHAITTPYDKAKLSENTRNVIMDYLACGLDPEKSIITAQSLVPEHTYLAHILSSEITVARMQHLPTFKEKVKQHPDHVTMALLNYPVLMASDILLYKAEKVPVGEDQLPHFELTREIARRFNRLFRPVFPEPKAILTQAPKLPGLDGRKMSKSYGNTIELSDGPETVDKKVLQMVTDPARKRREDKGHPEVCPVYFYHTLLKNPAVETVSHECRNALRGCVECKQEMAGHFKAFLGPVYRKRKDWEKRKTEVVKILDEGARRAREIAQATMREAKQAAGML